MGDTTTTPTTAGKETNTEKTFKVLQMDTCNTKSDHLRPALPTFSRAGQSDGGGRREDKKRIIHILALYSGYIEGDCLRYRRGKTVFTTDAILGRFVLPKITYSQMRIRKTKRSWGAYEEVMKEEVKATNTS
ncbi:hypothetical protein CHS0354_016719 [Potamilus streckersoni]|uniref:Uncharacterized protein n=1 Tax=Potamilus streckersoni TaxID=2493646 RepID=A0AAE0WAR4_9BIVA|nr:hypothetical protein CHS0354_016719 [Potamilus streckersoni]